MKYTGYWRTYYRNHNVGISGEREYATLRAVSSMKKIAHNIVSRNRCYLCSWCVVNDNDKIIAEGRAGDIG